MPAMCGRSGSLKEGMMSVQETMQKPLSQQEFAALGMEAFAYIKPIELQGQTAEGEETSMPAFAICAADGKQLAVAANRDAAWAAVVQHGLEPLSLH